MDMDTGQPLHPESSESDFLIQQSEAAKAAIRRALSEVGSALGQGIDPSALTRQHPWMTLGASAAAGFVAAAMLIPSKEEQALKKLAAIERALTPPPPRPTRAELAAAAAAGGTKSSEVGYKAGHHGLMKAILGEVIGAIKPAVISLLTAGVTAQAAKPTPEEMKAAAAAENYENARGTGTPPQAR